MAAPTPTARGTPTGIPLRDGHQVLVTIASDDDINIWEVEITPPPMDGGEPVDQTTQHNTTYHTKRPSSLIDMGECSFTGAFDPLAMTELRAIINQETIITITYADGSTDCFFGYVRTANQEAQSRGTQPRITVTIVCTNWDYTNSIEAGPALAEVAGT